MVMEKNRDTVDKMVDYLVEVGFLREVWNESLGDYTLSVTHKGMKLLRRLNEEEG